MILVQNEFIFLTNAYYQAHAYSIGMKASGLFEESEIHTEHYQFREMLKESGETLFDLIKDGEKAGNKGQVEKMIIKLKLSELYKTSENFILELENSINKYFLEATDLSMYRILFQIGTDSIYSNIGCFLESKDNHISKSEGIKLVIDNILHQNYWEGEEIKQQIGFIRQLNDSLFFSENWLNEYANKMF
jgi:hypothetical protein